MSSSEIQVRIASISTPDGQPLIKGVEFNWIVGRTIALVGKSGLGKSLICKAIAGLLPANLNLTGNVLYKEDQSETMLSNMGEDLRTAWNAGRMVYLTQETDLAFNPIRKIRKSFRDALVLARKPASRLEMANWFQKVDLPADALDRFPHELSGGQVQRALLAIALATGAQWLIADEPTSNLDKLTQKTIIELIIHLQKEMHLSLLLVTHDTKLWQKLTDNVVQLSPPPTPHPPLNPIPSSQLPELLRVSGLSFDYQTGWWNKRVSVLRDIELTVHEREWVGVIGQSGGGKSTLAKLITQLLRFQNGSITFQEKSLERFSRTERSSLIQMVFQNPYTSLNPRLSILDQLKDAVSEDDASTPWLPFLRAFELSHLDLTRLPTTYSGGERQRLAIIRALLKKPQLLICDEAISSLDPDNQFHTIQTLLDITNENGMAVLFISHDLTWIREACTRSYVLDRGEIVESGPTSQILSNPKHPYTQAIVATL